MIILLVGAIGFKIVEVFVIWYVMVVRRKAPEYLNIYLPLSTLAFILMILYNAYAFH